MRGKSFSVRLSWWIIGIVSVITILTQVAVYYASESIPPSPLLRVVVVTIGLFSLAAIFFACRAVIKHMTRPVADLSEAVLKMANGNLNAKLPEIKSEDEMRRLRDSFQTMQSSLVEYIDELKISTAANERIQSDLDLARNIQRGMLLKDFPPFLYAMLHPAKLVGGDLYDYTLKDDQLYFAIGDVSGKGVAASLVMAIMRVLLRFVVSEGQPLDVTLQRINNTFSDHNDVGMFVTLFVARIDLKTGHMDYCNAGHNPILIIPPDEEPYFLHCKANIASGLVLGFKYEAEQIDLKPGTRIIAYTDGVTEAEKADKSQYGEERLLEWARVLDESALGPFERPQGPQGLQRLCKEKDIVESLYNSVKDFTEDNPQNDDITIVSLKLETDEGLS